MSETTKAKAKAKPKITTVDDYIQAAQPQWRPILTRLRRAVHKTCPEVEEALKWGVPFFLYHGMLGGMAAFKNYVTFGFWKSRLMKDPAGLFQGDRKASMCGMRFASVRDLPADSVLAGYVREAMDLNEKGAKEPKRASRKPAAVTVPKDLAAALAKNRKAKLTFDSFSPSHKREYVEWITEAKQDVTRQRRLQTAVEWMAEGKPRNWKYMRAT